MPTMSALWKSLALLTTAGVIATACTPSPASGQTSTPTLTPTMPSAPTRGETSREAAATVPPTRDTSDPNVPRSATVTDVCNPCMVMRVTQATAAGRLAEPITGEVTAKGKEGTIKVLSYEHEVKAPRDIATGQSTGRRQYQPIRIVKEVDKATPLLAKALVEGTRLTITLEFYRPKADGSQERYYTVELKEVLVSGISVFGFSPEALQESAAGRSFVLPHVLETSGKATQQEELLLTFGRIVQTYEPGKTMAEDSWSG